MRPLFILALAAAAITLGPRPVQASELPWCLIAKDGGEQCRFKSLDACLQDRIGAGFFCNPNPRYQGETRRTKKPPRRDGVR